LTNEPKANESGQQPLYRSVTPESDEMLNGTFQGWLEVFTETRSDSYLDVVCVPYTSLSRSSALHDAWCLQIRLGIEPIGLAAPTQFGRCVNIDDRRLAGAIDRFEKQVIRIESLTAADFNTVRANVILDIMIATLKVMLGYRRVLVSLRTRLDRGSAT
jgi:hypothetical protein